jgi:hypothetical protein
MPKFIEKVFISEFNILPNKSIGVRKTTQVLKDEAVISETHWRCVLAPHDPQAESVLGDEPFYLALATAAWKDVPQPETAEPEAAESE